MPTLLACNAGIPGLKAQLARIHSETAEALCHTLHNVLSACPAAGSPGSAAPIAASHQQPGEPLGLHRQL